METIPDLVAEVRSKNDTPREMQDKAAEYQAAGVRVVWLVDPFLRKVEHRLGGVRVYTEAETLTADDVIPGFALAVGLALQE